MCGVVGIVYQNRNPNLGIEASALLRKLEYRGYDSTGGAFFQTDGTVILKKKVGSPTKVIETLELERDGGQRFIGQVRWATYGSVTDVNAQPHRVQCRQHLIGAHNGNISNTDNLKEYLSESGHSVLSDNDGEMLVHEVEHCYDAIVRLNPPASDEERIQATIEAIRRTETKAEGSYAACFGFPDLPGIFAVKSGSSLYAGKGTDSAGDFVVVSSDLTSVLSKTRFLIPLAEGEGLYFTHDEYRVFSLSSASTHKPALRRSRLNVADITLQSRYRYFMHQEIESGAENVDRIIKYYFMEDGEAVLFDVFESCIDQCKAVIFELLKLYDVFSAEDLSNGLRALLDSPDAKSLFSAARDSEITWPLAQARPVFTSDEAQLLSELYRTDRKRHRELWLLDQVVIWKKKRKTTRFSEELTKLIATCKEQGGRVFTIGAGTSHHAALVGAYFFNDIARLAIHPVNPGMFRSMYINALTEQDIIIGVTQSGETKDLLDIFNDVRSTYGSSVKLISMVNNELSTIPQEKSDFFIPVLCGPEIAVPATKSFFSQVAIFHMLACKAVMDSSETREQLEHVRAAIDFTLRAVEEDTAEVALKFFMAPSIHILGTSLIGLAKEGALKIREVVLNHTEGYDSAEFKHGPNTILGKNTLFSLSDMTELLRDAFEFFGQLSQCEPGQEVAGHERLQGQLAMLKDLGFGELQLDAETRPNGLSWTKTDTHKRYKDALSIENYFGNYPLFFFCPPDQRDINITISQIHTHKIRGADIVLIARDNEALRKSVEGKPAEVDDYYAKLIRVPTVFGKHTFVYQVAVVLQVLALKMSVAKMKYLNRHHIENHGVHPDVPKNVSKSITVD